MIETKHNKKLVLRYIKESPIIHFKSLRSVAKREKRRKEKPLQHERKASTKVQWSRACGSWNLFAGAWAFRSFMFRKMSNRDGFGNWIYKTNWWWTPHYSQMQSHCSPPRTKNHKTDTNNLLLFCFFFNSFAFFLLPPFCCYFLMRSLFFHFFASIFKYLKQHLTGEEND